jgi:hypothetical protein
MKSRIRYTDSPLGQIEIVPDFLPKPDELVPKVDTVKITVALSRTSVESFKGEAKKSGTSYQRMIRNLLDLYAGRYGKPGARGGGSKAGKRKVA